MQRQPPKEKEELHSSERESSDQAGAKPAAELVVYPPNGMSKAFRELSKQFNIKNRISKMKEVSESVNVMNDGREQRQDSKKVQVPHSEQLAMQHADRVLIQKEIKYIKRLIAAFNELKNQPIKDANDYNEFVTKYNKFVGGINHHLSDMQKAASKIPGLDDLQQEIKNMMQQKIPSKDVKVAIETQTLPEFHQAIIDAGILIEKAIGKSDKNAALAKLDILLDKPNIDINVVDQHGNTVLHLAAEKGLVNLAKYLVEHTKINTGILNYDEMSASAIARAKAFEERKASQLSNSTHDKSESKYSKIMTLLNPASRRETARIAKEIEKEDVVHNSKENATSIFTKYFRNFTSLNKNIADVEFGHMPYLVVNRNYINHEATKNERLNYSSFGKLEATKLLNPLYAMNTALTFANLGIRLLVDKISNQIVDKVSWMNKPPKGYAGPIAIVLKTVLTFPISIAEAVIGGAADLISLGVNTGIDAVKKNKESTPVKDVTPSLKVDSSSTLIATTTLSAHPVVTTKKEIEAVKAPAIVTTEVKPPVPETVPEMKENQHLKPR